MVSYNTGCGTFANNSYSIIYTGKAMTEEEDEEEEFRAFVDGASEEAVLLAELSCIMLNKFKSHEKLHKKDFDAMWYAHVNLTMLWQEALSTKGAPSNGKLN